MSINIIILKSIFIHDTSYEVIFVLGLFVMKSRIYFYFCTFCFVSKLNFSLSYQKEKCFNFLKYFVVRSQGIDYTKWFLCFIRFYGYWANTVNVLISKVTALSAFILNGVSMVAAHVHWVPLGMSNWIHKYLLVVSGTCIQTLLVIDEGS